jgi:RNA polymerase sporulation-specific sigma factor
MYEVETEEIIKAQNKSEEALTNLVEKNSGLVWSIVKRFSGRGHSTEDLYQIGCIGLIKAIQRFDANYNAKLSTYAVPYIIGEIKRFIRDDGPIKVSRSIKELAMKIIELQRENLNKTGKELQINELAKILGIEKENIVVAMDAIRRPESIDEEIYDEVGGETKASRISTNKDETEKTINKICVQELIEELNEDEKQIILLRYYKGKTQSEVAQRLKISQVQVSRIEKKTLLKMRSKIA